MPPETIAPPELRRFDRQFAGIRALAPERVLPGSDRNGRRIQALSAGGFLRFGGRTYRVEAVAEYQETDEGTYSKHFGDTWPEAALLELETGETRYLEWEEDDGLEIYFSRRRIRFRDLADEDGQAVDEDDLDPACEAEDSFFLDRREFEHDDDYAAVYRRDGKEEPVYLYEFLASNGDSLTIEQWVGSPGSDRTEHQLWVSERLDPDAIEILATSS